MELQQALLRSCMSCNCGPVIVVDKDTIAYLAANSVVLWNITYNRKDYIWHDSLGITACAASPRNGLVAVGEEGTNPNVVVYTYPSKQIVRTLRAGAQIMYSALAFSRDGKRLVTVGDYPDYKLIVWEDDRELIKVNLMAEPLKVIMHSGILLLFKHEVRKITLEKAFTVPEENFQLDLHYRVVQSDFQLAESIPLDALWDRYGNIYLSTNAAEILVIKNNLKDTLLVHKLDFNALSITLVHKYLIVSTSDNRVQYLQVYKPPEKNKGKNGTQIIPLKAAKELLLDEPQDIIQTFYTADMAKLVLVGAQGKIQVLHQQAEPKHDPDEQDIDRDDDPEDDEDDELAHKPKPIIATPQILGNFHVGTVKSVVCLGDSTQCASIGEDLRIWEVVTGENLMQYTPPDDVEFLSIDANITGCILFAGSNNGVIRVFDVSNRMVCRLMEIHKIMDGGIDQLFISPDQKLLACSSQESNIIYFIEATPNSQFRVLGYTDVKGNVVSIVWYKRKIILLTQDGLLGMLDAPRPDSPSQLGSFEIPVLYRHIEPGNQIAVNQDAVYIAGCSRDIYVYQLPDQEYDEIDIRKDPPQPYETIKAHSVFTCLIKFSPDMRLMAVGSIDGYVKIGEIGEIDNEPRRIHGPSGVQNISFSADSTLLFTTGKERDFFSWSLTGRTLDRPVPASISEDPQLETMDTRDDVGNEELQSFSQILQDQITRSEAREVERVKAKSKEKLKEIQEKLKIMLEANEAAPELERLERDEFVLNLQEKEGMEKLGSDEAERLRMQAQKENLAKELLKERIRDNTWGKMEVNCRVISAMLGDNIVSNYGIRKLASEELRKFSQARCFRIIELKEEAQRREQHIEEVFDNERFAVNWIVGKRASDWKEHPLLQLLQSNRAIEKKDEDEAVYNEWDLVYPPLLVFTQHRKKIQIFLLQMLIRALKQGFNVEFENLEKFKVKQADTIGEKNVAIAEKQEELALPKKLFQVTSHILEEPEKMLQVEESEITVEKYLNREQRAALEEARKKEEERIRLLNADDSKRRALQNMMGGTIETKKDTYSLLNEELVREEFMNMPYEEMTDDQRRKFKDFQEREKKLQEEKDRLRKILDGELKQLQSSVKDIATKFDEKLANLFLLRINTDYEIYQLELIINKLQLSLLMEQKRKQDVQQLTVQEQGLGSKINIFIDQSYTLDQRIKEIESEINNKDKDIQQSEKFFADSLKTENISQQLIDQLKKLVKNGTKRQQAIKKRLEPEAERLISQLNPLDPYTPSEIKELRLREISDAYQEIEENDIVQLRSSAPQHVVDNTVFRRKDKIEKLMYRDRMKELVKDSTDYKQWLEQKLKRKKNEHKQKQQLLKERQEEDEKEYYNTDLLLKMRQSIVEVPQQPVVTDYSDAILIPRNVIEKYNKEIRKVGEEKVKILKQVAENRAGLKFKEWEKQAILLECKHFKKCEKDVKMLRIDKRLQNILAGRGLDENKVVQNRLDRQLVQLTENTSKRLDNIRKKEDMLKKQIRELNGENERLREEIYQMKQQAEQRQSLFGIKKFVSDQARHDPAGKFKQISARRNLLDQIKSHAEEIEFLKDELDRLRAKTFPSFAHLQAYVDYPDEY